VPESGNPVKPGIENENPLLAGRNQKGCSQQTKGFCRVCDKVRGKKSGFAEKYVADSEQSDNSPKTIQSTVDVDGLTHGESVYGLRIKEALNKSFDKLRTNAKLLILFIVSLSNHKRDQFIQSFLNVY
jgi:hypothetical protein